MFADAELVNNRIGAYKDITNFTDSVGFHTHGSRKEQELYIIMEGTEYLEKNDLKAKKKIYIRKKYYYNERFRISRFKNIEIRIIIFVITTNE
jgi:hypothetical protein